MTTIMVVVREITDGVEKWRKTEKFKDDGRALETYFREMKRQHPDAHFHLVNCTTPSPPPAEFVQTSTMWWCPYCARGRWFWWDDTFELYRCNVCTITDRNFYVNQYNRVPERKVSHSTNDDE